MWMLIKKSLWVKWISTVKLKGKSVWSVNEARADSWGLRNILRLRQEVSEHMVMQLGNGRSASIWFDNWSPIGVVYKFISYRELYNARLDSQSSRSDGEWGVDVA